MLLIQVTPDTAGWTAPATTFDAATSNLRFQPLNAWAIGLAVSFLATFVIMWWHLKPEPAAVRLFLYELFSSESPRKPYKRAADLGKVIGAFAFILVVFLCIKKAFTTLAQGTSLSDGNIDSLLWFTAACLGIIGAADLLRGKLTGGTVTIEQPPGQPVPVVPTPAPAQNADPAHNPDETQ